MSRFVVVVDWASRLDLPGALRRAREVMTLGGSREQAFEICRPPFGALVLSHRGEAPLEGADGSVTLAGGFGPAPGTRVGFLQECRAALAPGGQAAVPPPPEGAGGRRSYLQWESGAQELLAVTEPNGLEPVYYLHSGETTVVATEPKGIWALRAAHLHPDVNGLADLYTVGHCLAGRTLFEEIACAEPGTILRFGREGALKSRSYASLRFAEERGGDGDALAEFLNRGALDALGAYKAWAPRVTVALSGGMDSRYVLAAARKVWERVESFTFGEPRSLDVVTARRLARRAGIVHREYPTSNRFLADWAGYAVWRMDGQLSCLHAQGMDAVIEHSRRARDLLNGVCGDVLLGAFLRPSHLTQGGEPERAARHVLSARRFHDRELAGVFKPEVIARATVSSADTVRHLAGRNAHARLGNTLLAYWLRHYVPRTTVMGLSLETPFVEHLGPLADPCFVRAAQRLPLELRFMARAYRRALARLAPELARERWGRVGMAPRWPWPLLALGKAGIRFGLLPRPRPALDYARQLRTALLPWLEGVLLSAETRADGYFLPRYLEDIVERHARGKADHTAELGMAVTVELWRRMFIEGRAEYAGHPEMKPPA